MQMGFKQTTAMAGAGTRGKPPSVARANETVRLREVSHRHQLDRGRGFDRAGSVVSYSCASGAESSDPQKYIGLMGNRPDGRRPASGRALKKKPRAIEAGSQCHAREKRKASALGGLAVYRKDTGQLVSCE